MTAPRQVLPGTTYLVTRRCSQRQFLLRPSRATNQVFGYVLAVAARRFGIQIHAFCVLSNHFHLVVTDPHARLPAFEQYLDSLVARALNAALGRWESFWAPASYSAVTLPGPEDVVDKAAYTLANPVAAGLVARGREWPGLWSPPEQIGVGRMKFRRPKGFFREKGPMPAVVDLRLTEPPGFASSDDFRARLRAALGAREEQAAVELAAKGRSFVGAARALREDADRSASSPEPRRQLRPSVAGLDKWKRIEALTRLAAFLETYRTAWLEWTQGNRDVVFPAGTYLMRVAHDAACVAPG